MITISCKTIKGSKFTIICCMLFVIYLGKNINCKKIKHAVNYSSMVKNCENVENDYIDTHELKATRYNETIAVLDGMFTLKKGFTSPTRLGVTAYRILPMGATEIVGTLERDLCDDVKSHDPKNVVASYLKYINFTDECPVPPGTYCIDHMVADTDAIPNKSAMEGKYTIKFEFFPEPSEEKKGGKMLGPSSVPKADACLLFDVSIEKVT